MEYGCCKLSVILFYITIVFIGLGDGERFFQYRDHRDQGMYDKQTGSLAVHNKLEAEVSYLLYTLLIWYFLLFSSFLKLLVSGFLQPPLLGLHIRCAELSEHNSCFRALDKKEHFGDN